MIFLIFLALALACIAPSTRTRERKPSSAAALLLPPDVTAREGRRPAGDPDLANAALTPCFLPALQVDSNQLL